MNTQHLNTNELHDLLHYLRRAEQLLNKDGKSITECIRDNEDESIFDLCRMQTQVLRAIVDRQTNKNKLTEQNKEDEL